MANQEYKSYFRTIGTSPYVAGSNGAPEVHCIMGEYAFCKAIRTAQTNGGPKEVLDTTLFIKGQASEIQHFFPGATVMDDGSIAVNCSLWGEDAKKVDAEAMAADQAGCKRNVRVAMAGYLYMDTYQKDGQQRMSLKFNCQWLASAKAKKPKQNNQSYGGQQQYNGQQYANAPQYNGQQYANAPQYNGQQYQQPAQAPQYQQPAPAQQYQQPAPTQQYQQPAPAQQYQQPAPAQQPMQPAQAQPPMPSVPAQQPMQPAPAQYAGAPGPFAIIQDDDEEVPF